MGILHSIAITFFGPYQHLLLFNSARENNTDYTRSRHPVLHDQVLEV